MASSKSYGLCWLMQCLCRQTAADKEVVAQPTSLLACTAVVSTSPCVVAKAIMCTAGAVSSEEITLVQEAAAGSPSAGSTDPSECNNSDTPEEVQQSLLQEPGEATAVPSGDSAISEEAAASTAAAVSSPAAEMQQTAQLTTPTCSNSISVSITDPALPTDTVTVAAAGTALSPSSGKPAITSSRVLVEAAHVLCTDDARSTIKALLTELFKPAQQRRRSDTGEAAEFRTTAAQYKACLAQLPDCVQCRLLELGDDDKAAVFKVAVPLWLGDISDSKSLWDCLCVALQQHRQRRMQPEDSKQQDKLPKSPGRTQPFQDKAVDSSSAATTVSAAEQEQQDAAPEEARSGEKPATVAAAGCRIRPTSRQFSSSSIQEHLTEDAAFLELTRLSTQSVRTSFSVICRNAECNTACLQGLNERRCAVAIYNLPKKDDEVLIKQLIKAHPKTCISDAGLQLLKELAAHYVQHMADTACADPAVPVKLPGWVK